MGRKFLLTKFVCARCGGNLDTHLGPLPRPAEHENSEPTGADKVDMLVVLEPCRTCEKPLRDAEQAIKHLAALAHLAGGE